MLEYKGYRAQVEFDDSIRAFIGEVIDTRDKITFEATSVDELEREFHASIDDYLSWCESEGVEPERPYSGNLVLRLSPDLHRSIARESADEGMSINAYIAKKLKDG